MIMFNIFEYPFVGIGLAVVSMIALWIFGAFFPQKRRRWHFAVPFVIAILAFAVAFFVQTDREKILSAVGKGIKAFELQNIEPISQIIADDYSDAAHSSKELILAYCQALFQTAAVEKVTTFSRNTEINGVKAVFTTEALVKFTENSEIARMGKAFLIVKARFYFKKTQAQANKWLINSSEILELDRNPVSWNQLRN
jgi:hypothetical protein